MARASNFVPTALLPPTENAAFYGVKRVAWGAVLAGVVLGLAIEAAFGVLATGIGLSLIDSGAGITMPAFAAGSAAAAWWVASTLVAMFFGGWAAAYLASPSRRGDGALHGILVWAVSTVLMLYLFGSAFGALAAGAFGTLSRFATAITQTSPPPVTASASTAPSSSDTIEQISQEARELIANAKQAGAGSQPDISGAVANINELLLQWFRDDADSADAREALIGALTAQAGMSREEAELMLSDWLQRYAGTKAQVESQSREVADRAARSVARAAWVAFIAMLIGVAVAALGGALAARRPSPLAAMYT